MKKIIFILTLIFSGLLVLTESVYALTPIKIREQLKATNQGEIKEFREKIQNEVKENFASKAGLLKLFRNGKIAFENGELKSISGNTLTISKEDKTYTVLVDENTKLIRKFWGKSELSEFSVGDKLNIVGTWEDEEKTTIRARFIRNISIQMRHGVFIGEIKNLNGNSFSLETVARGTQQVTVDNNTKYVNRKQELISLADLQVGHRVKVRGLWNSKSRTITEVSAVKDFSLPPVSRTSGSASVKPE